MARPKRNKGFTGIAHTLIEALAAADLSSNEFRVLLLLLRDTYGEPDPLDSTRQLECAPFGPTDVADRTDLSPREVRRALADLTKRKIVRCYQPASGSRPGIYGPQKDFDLWEARKSGGSLLGGLLGGEDGTSDTAKLGTSDTAKASKTGPRTDFEVNGRSPLVLGVADTAKLGMSDTACTIIDDHRLDLEEEKGGRGDLPGERAGRQILEQTMPGGYSKFSGELRGYLLQGTHPVPDLIEALRGGYQDFRHEEAMRVARLERAIGHPPNWIISAARRRLGAASGGEHLPRPERPARPRPELGSIGSIFDDPEYTGPECENR